MTDFSKELLPHYVKDGEEIVVDKRVFRMRRSPKSTANVDRFLISAIPQKPDRRSLRLVSEFLTALVGVICLLAWGFVLAMIAA